MLDPLPMQLVTIAFSHYNERARWALDRFGVAYRERGCLPVLHMPAVMLATGLRGGRADRGSSRYSTPVLVTDEGERLCDSGEIVRFASDRFGTPETTLYPEEHRDEIEQLEQRVHDHVGPHSRRVAYFHVLGQPGLLRRLGRANVGPVQAWAFAAMTPIVRPLLRKALRIDEARSEASLARLRVEIEGLGERLGDRPYLVGDRFTAADLTTACMLAPVIVPSRREGYGATLPSLDEMTPQLRALVLELRDTPIGRFALRMFARERTPAGGSRPADHPTLD